MACFFVTVHGNVLVTIHYKFQQSIQMTVVVPRLQYIDRVWTLQLCHRDRCAQCTLCRRVKIPKRSSWMLVAVLIVVRQVRLGPDSAEKCQEVPQLQSIVVLVQFLGKVIVGRSWCSASQIIDVVEVFSFCVMSESSVPQILEVVVKVFSVCLTLGSRSWHRATDHGRNHHDDSACA